MIFAIIASSIFAIAQFADGISTYIGLKRGGKEANPLLRWLAKSPVALTAVKFAIGIGVPLYELHNPYMPGLIVMAVVAGLPGYVAAQNIARLIKGKN